MSDFSDFENDGGKDKDAPQPEGGQKESKEPESNIFRLRYHKGPMTRGDWLWVIGQFATPAIVLVVILGLKSGLNRALNMMRIFFFISIGIAGVFGIYFLLKGIVLGLIWLCRRLLGSAKKKEKEPENQAALPENSALPPEYRVDFDRDGRDVFDRENAEFEAGRRASEWERERN